MSGNARPCTGNVHGECQGMHSHAQGMFKGNVRECMAMQGNVEGECQGMHGHAQGMFKGNVRECMAMHKKC